MRHHLLVPAVLALTLLAGCFRLTTTYVRVNDPAAVALAAGPQEVLPPGREPRVAKLAEGRYWYLLTRLPYEIHAVREPTGAVALRCDACGHAPWPMTGTAAVLLVDPEGAVRPAFGRARLTREAIVLPADVTFVRAPRRLQPVVAARPDLIIPWQSVVTARQVRRPLPWWAATFPTAIGAGWIGLGAYFLDISQRLGSGTRYGVGVPVITVGAALLGVGLWHLLAPVREEALRPP
ncbi:MAG TPA: hypothetical protein VGQ83_09285 [Polyangia bacterium]